MKALKKLWTPSGEEIRLVNLEGEKKAYKQFKQELKTEVNRDVSSWKSPAGEEISFEHLTQINGVERKCFKLFVFVRKSWFLSSMASSTQSVLLEKHNLRWTAV